MALTPVAERLAVKLSLPGLFYLSVAAGIQTLNLPHAGRMLKTTAPCGGDIHSVIGVRLEIIGFLKVFKKAYFTPQTLS